jgi:lipopolysaccharide/colanic/teichoic acid biosynthesis glycosyltransferase
MKKNSFYVKVIKRLLDIIISLMTLVILSPVILLLMVTGLIALSGNPFFTQDRPGKNEKIFKLIKFRTMSNKKDSDGNLLPDEQRMNGYGRFLRATSLDELPEFLNILKGDMSLVGPRPLLVQYIPRYNEFQHHRHDVLPGLTGHAQVNGRNALSWDEKFALDIWYVENVSFIIDLKIVLKTFTTVFSHKGVHSETSVSMEEFMGNGPEKEEK